MHLPATDIDLWNETQQGNKNSFEQLFKYYYPYLFNYGLNHYHNENLVEDCIQEIFLDLWNKASALQIYSFKAYIFQAFRFKLYRKLDKDKKIIALQEQVDGYGLFSMNKEDILIKEEMDKEKLARIQAAIEQLSKRQQEIIYLRFYLNIEHQDICKIMNISYQVSRNLLSQSLKVLKKEMGLKLLLIYLLTPICRG